MNDRVDIGKEGRKTIRECASPMMMMMMMSPTVPFMHADNSIQSTWELVGNRMRGGKKKGRGRHEGYRTKVVTGEQDQ